MKSTTSGWLGSLKAKLRNLRIGHVDPRWLPPRGADFGAMVENIAGQWIPNSVVEKKAVPSAAVRQEWTRA